MELLLLLFGLQLVAIIGGFVFLSRRLEAATREITQLRAALENSQAVPQRKRANLAAVPSVAASDVVSAPAVTRSMRNWNFRAVDDQTPLGLPNLTPETLRGIVLAVMAVVPALGFVFNADQSATITSGLTIAAAMMLIALRPTWRAASWAAVLTGSAWAALGFVRDAEPISFALCITIAAIAGLAHAHLRRAPPGAVMTLAMSAAALALGAQLGMIGPGGIAFGVIVASAAAVGAMTLRLEAIHLAAFGAALIGLFVLTGQESAAIWFTPVTAWTGAWFFALAIIRVPQLGAQGAALAGTGALAPLLAAGALHLSAHGLANNFAASAAFAVVALAISTLIALAASREERGVAALRLTLWILSLAAFCAISASILIAAPAPVAAPAFAIVALLLVGLDTRAPDAAWRTFAGAAALMAALNGIVTIEMHLAENSGWPLWALVITGLLLPATILGGAAFLAQRNDAPVTAACMETVAISGSVIAASLLLRTLWAGGTPSLHHLTFVEAGMHIAVWLAFALALAARAKSGATIVRQSAAALLGGGSLVACAVITVLWLTPFWTARAQAGSTIFDQDPVGFALPAIVFWLHWVLWRSRGSDMRTRVSLGAGALMTAGFITLTVTQIRAAAMPDATTTDWLSVMVGAIVFALALGLNFAPGVVNPTTARQLDLEEYLKRNRRGQERREAR